MRVRVIQVECVNMRLRQWVSIGVPGVTSTRSWLLIHSCSCRPLTKYHDGSQNVQAHSDEHHLTQPVD